MRRIPRLVIAANEREIAEYRRTHEALLGLIDPQHRDAATRSERLRRAEERLHRTHRLLSALGDPHLRYPVVHVTGTSGKGSTCAAIAAILTAAGYRVGLRTSPYLQVATEKLQIGVSLIDASSFASESALVLEVAQRLVTGSGSRRPSYAEVWSGIAFSWFARREVDIAVVEVGAGGRFDSTNVVQPAVSIITSVGLDHLVSLGPTLADIAWHKAGIIKPGSVAVIGNLPVEALPIVHEAASAAHAPIVVAGDSDVPLSLTEFVPAHFQRQNAKVTIAAVAALRRQGFHVPDRAILAGITGVRLPGRLEFMPGAGIPRVWIDGAHNPDKMDALFAASDAFVRDDILPVVILGVLDSKDVAALASRVCGGASAIVATEPSVLGKTAISAKSLARGIRDCGFTGLIDCEANPREALRAAVALATARDADVLVTGSLYLAGEIRRHWYPDEQVVLQRTSWPSTRRPAHVSASV
jgi:dihydrofolate synthase/folylpolyglutamate synthase